MIYIHIISEYDEYLLSNPNMRFSDSKLRVSSKIGGELYKIPIKSIKKIDVISKPDNLLRVLTEIVNKQA